MASGDIEVYGPFVAEDTTAIDTGLTGNGIAAADNITCYRKGNQVFFVVVKA